MKALITALFLLFALPANATLMEVMVHVQVRGEVQKPGLYTLPSQSRIADAIQLAGGLKPGASVNALNLSAAINDGQAILVPKYVKPSASAPLPTVQAVRKKSARRHTKPVMCGKIALNRAGLAELDQLPGIGPSLAKDILEYRTRHGHFRSLEELQEIPGIGEKRFQRLKGHLVL